MVKKKKNPNHRRSKLRIMMINQMISTTLTMIVMIPSSILKLREAQRERPIYFSLKMTLMGQEMTLKPTDKGRLNFSRTLRENLSLIPILRGMTVEMNHKPLGRRLAKSRIT